MLEGTTVQQQQLQSPKFDQEEFTRKIVAIFPLAALTKTLHELKESLTTHPISVSEPADPLTSLSYSTTSEATQRPFSDNASTYGEDIAATLVANAKSKKRRRH